MTTIQEIYDTYTIPPRLQQHMYRVAGVGKFLSMHAREPLDEDVIVAACLLHDIGNIIKFNLDVNPATDVSAEENEYRKQVQQNFIQRYGSDEKEAHRAICAEITHNPRVLELIDHVGIRQIPYHLGHMDLAAWIVNYADLRVAPHGICSMQERLEEGFARNKRRYATPEESEEYRSIRSAHTQEFEVMLFQHLTIIPDEIAQAAIEDLIRELPSFELSR